MHDDFHARIEALSLALFPQARVVRQGYCVYFLDLDTPCFRRSQELCESQSGRPGLPVPNSPYGFCGCKATAEH